MKPADFTTLPESAFALPSSYYASVEVIETPTFVVMNDWVVLREWDEVVDTLLGYEFQDARIPR